MAERFHKEAAKVQIKFESTTERDSIFEGSHNC
jgi:hypothetical protein